MPCRLSETTLRVPCNTLDARGWSLEASYAPAACYPFPEIQMSSGVQTTEIPAIVLENDLIRATILPSLGGRIISLIHKQSGHDCLAPFDRIEPRPGGRRGVQWKQGIRWTCGEEERDNDLGPVEVLLDPPQSDGEGATVTCFELQPGAGLCAQVRYSLDDGSAELQMEFMAVNRTFDRVPCRLVIEQEGQGEGGVDIRWAPGSWEATSQGAERKIGSLGPRAVDSATLLFRPYGGQERPSASGDGALLWVTGNSIRIEPHRLIGDCKVFVDRHGQTLEASVHLDPEFPVQLEFEGAEQVAVLDEHRKEVVRWPSVAGKSMDWQLRPPAGESTLIEGLATRDRSLMRAASRDPGCRAAGNLAEAQVCFLSGNWEDAAHHAEEALLFEGNNPLTWWELSLSKRLGDERSEDGRELLNAEFLMPLDPLVRAEAFLSQTESTPEPSPLVAPLANDPEAMVEVACHLLTKGLHRDAQRWIYECLRHRKSARLIDLRAWSLLTNGNMKLEATTELAKAKDLPWEPPYPWRTIDRQVYTELCSAFPSDSRLGKIAFVLSDLTSNHKNPLT